jgi:hypothetical protein
VPAVVDNSRVADRGTYAAEANFFNKSGHIISEKSISRIWKKAVKNHHENCIYAASPCHKGRSGKNRIYDPEEIKAEIDKLPNH